MSSIKKTIGSTIHLLKACIGTGVLAMPSAFKSCGLVAGLFGTVIAGILSTYTTAMLVLTAQRLCVEMKKPRLTFSETCDAAFSTGPHKFQKLGYIFKIFSDACMGFTYFSVCTVYVVFIASSFKEIIDHYYPEHKMSIELYCVFQIVPLILLCQVRNLKFLVPFMTTANVILVVILCITLSYVFTDLPPMSDRNLIVGPRHWPKFLSVVVFAMEGIGVVMPVENEMIHPDKFLGCRGVLMYAMVTVVVLLSIVGFFGYLKYGENAKGSITLNLPEDRFVARSVVILMALSIFLTYALQFYVIVEIMMRHLKERGYSKNLTMVEIIIRAVLVIISVVVAVSFPNLEFVIGITGAIFFTTLGLIIPAIVHTVFRWDRGLGKYNYVLWKNIFIILCSLIILVSGTYQSIIDMYQKK